MTLLGLRFGWGTAPSPSPAPLVPPPMSLVELFSSNWKKTTDLREKQVQLGHAEHKLMGGGGVATRWGSTYNMVSRIVEQQLAIKFCAALAKDRKGWHPMPSESEFSPFKSLIEILMCGERHVQCQFSILTYLLTNRLHVEPGSNGLIEKLELI